MPVETYIKVSLSMIRKRERVDIHVRVEKYTMVGGNKTSSMDK